MGSKKQVSQMSLEQCYLETGTVTKITKLVNAVFYFLEHVFIINSTGDYRLLVIHRKRVLWDKNYKSIKGARIAFSKRFGKMACKHLKKNIWSHRYRPEKEWLMDKLSLVNNVH